MKRNYYAYNGYRGRGRKRGNHHANTAPDPNAPPPEILETPYGIIDLTNTDVIDMTGPSHATAPVAAIPTASTTMPNRPQVGIPPPASYFQYKAPTQAQPAQGPSSASTGPSMAIGSSYQRPSTNMAATQAQPGQRPSSASTAPPMAGGSSSMTQEDEVDLTDEPDEVYGDIYLGQVGEALPKREPSHIHLDSSSSPGMLQ